VTEKAVVFAIVALIIGLVIGAGATYLATGGASTITTTTVTKTIGGATATTTATITTTLTTTATATASPAAGLPKEIVIGVVLPLSGDLASEGKLVSNALTLAEEDINNYLATLGLSTKVKFDVEDSKTTPEGGLQAVQSLAARGITCIIGPMISPAISASKDYVDSHHIVLLSQSSTAMSLAISDDFVFRLVTSDELQAKAIVKLMQEMGISEIAIIYRANEWGRGLADRVSELFEAAGGKVLDKIGYDPKAPEHSTEVARLADVISGASDLSKTAVLMISFHADGVDILNLAMSYPQLMQVAWFGTDGTAYSSKIADEAGEAASKVKLYSTMYAVISPLKDQFVQRFKERFGEAPDSYAILTYDCAWLYTLTILQTGSTDGEAIRKALPEVAARFYGISGWCILNEAGDRASGDYIVVCVTQENGQYIWKEVAIYHTFIDTVEWLESL